MFAVVDVRRGRDEVASRPLGLLLEADDAVVVVELDHAVEPRERRISETMRRDGAPVAFRAEERAVVPQRELEEIVGGDHEQGRLHARTIARTSESAYGDSWTPCSVTIALISCAGVTSNAGLCAAKRSVTSAGSRCSIGISAPRAVRWSTVELGATTYSGT